MIHLDANLRNADWTKHPSDLTTIKTKRDLWAMLQRQAMTMEKFKQLPVYTANAAYFDNLPEA